MTRVVAVVVVLTLVAASTAAVAERDYFTRQQKAPLTYRIEGERSRNERILVLSLLGGAVAAGSLGLVFHLKSRTAADEVSADSGHPTNLVYTPAIDGRRADAVSFRKVAIASYAVGGALLASAVVSFIVTTPPDQILEYGAGNDSRVGVPFVAPIKGGLVLGKQWTY